jgi:ATP-binding cassette subfamily B protein
MSINVWLSLIIFLCVPLLVFVSVKTRKKMRDAFMASRQAVGVINASVESSISGIRVTKAFTNAEKEKEKFEEGNVQFQDARRDAYKAMGEFHSMTTFVTDIFNVVILVAGGLFMYAGQIDFAEYSAINLSRVTS